MTKSKRIFLSPPHMGGEELVFVQEAFESNYIAPLGPQVDSFEKEFADYVGIKHCLALSSGTAAMHLALEQLGVGPGDEVFASTLTFIGSVNPIIYEGATPIFIDSEKKSWNMDPDLLEGELERCAKRGKLPKAVITTDLYGQCCDYERIFDVCEQYGVPVILDSAEAVGAKYRKTDDRGRKTEDRRQGAEDSKSRKSEGKSEEPNLTQRREGAKDNENNSDFGHQTSDLWRHAGVGARAAVFSFNGNKIMTTSGGGMLASDDKELIDYARFLSQQARDPFVHYEHSKIGYNYRMSNLLAATGRGQLRVIEERVRRRREIFDYYKAALEQMPGIEFMPEPVWSKSNRWLTVVLITPSEFGVDREAVRLALAKENIEARPVWKPMHLQPVFKKHGAKSIWHGGEKEQVSRKGAKAQGHETRVVGGKVAEDLFNRGLCLPSGTAMTEDDLDRVIQTIRSCRR